MYAVERNMLSMYMHECLGFVISIYYIKHFLLLNAEFIKSFVINSSDYFLWLKCAIFYLKKDSNCLFTSEILCRLQVFVDYGIAD